MTRATPYCSVRPSAMRAYMPPSTRPGRTISNSSMRWPLLARLQAELASLPLRLWHDRRASSWQRRRRECVEFAVLPLANAPHLLQQAILQLDLADDGIERA